MPVGGKYVTAYTGGTPIPGFKTIGKIAIDTNPGKGDYSMANFVGGVLETYDSTGYVIISDTTTADIVGRTTGNNTGTSGYDQPTFWVSPTKDDAGFLFLVNRLPIMSGITPFTDAVLASAFLASNGYWATYPTPVLSLDAANYSGSGPWVDSIGSKQFTLYNSPSWASSNGGCFTFDSSNSQYASTNDNLPDLSTWSIGVWHYYTNHNVGPYPTIVTEGYPGLTGQINYSLGWNYTTGYINAGFFDGVWRTSSNYALTPGSWYYIVGTYDGATINMYVNNNLVSTENYVGNPISSLGGIRLMRRWDDEDYWDGKLAVVNIYDQALDSGQISSIWNSTKSRFGL